MPDLKHIILAAIFLTRTEITPNWINILTDL